jgi:hypothetical protein
MAVMAFSRKEVEGIAVLAGIRELNGDSTQEQQNLKDLGPCLANRNPRSANARSVPDRAEATENR